MGGQRIPRRPHHLPIDDGTLPRTLRPMPGPTGATPEPISPRTFAMAWSEFRNSGKAVTNQAVDLGVMPHGQFLNAMEIVFREGDEAAGGRKALKGFCNYRGRQTLEERDYQFVIGQWGSWTSRDEGTPDDPDPLVQSWQPPLLRMYDTPGWSAYQGIGPSTRQLSANGVKSDVNATELWVQQVFKTWVQGEDCFTSMWSDASVKVTWHNSLHLVRDTPTSPWRQGANCKIGHGPMSFGTTDLL